jgi:hypothetical protein
MAAIWFYVGAAAFLTALTLAWRRWWNSLSEIDPAARFTLIATTVGALIGAPFWWADADASFAWNLPPLASRMLGAAATAFAVAGLYALERPTPARAWLHALFTAVYLVPLAAAIILLHLDRFDFVAPVTWGFFAAVGVLCITSLTGLRPATAAKIPAPRTERGWLFMAGWVLGAWGLALFAVPDTAWPPVFNWTADPLTSRLIASMLLTLAVVFFAASRDAALLTQAHLLGATYGIGVAMAIGVNLVRGLPWPPLYLAAFGLLGVVSLAFLLAGRSRPA